MFVWIFWIFSWCWRAQKNPPVNDPLESCGVGDKVNVLDIREGGKDKVILRYDYSASKLFVSICYSHFIIRDVSVSNYDELPQMEMVVLPTEQQDASSSSSSLVDIMGSNIFIGDEVYVVTNVADGQVTCASVDNEQLIVQLLLEDATNLIDDYNM